MKLVTFQSLDAVKDLFEKGYLECNRSKIDIKKAGPTYNWVIEKMNKLVKNEFNSSYPLWCWVKCYNSIVPPKRKGESVEGFDVKITFHKNKKDVFITDFRRYSFLLNNMYIPIITFTYFLLLPLGNISSIKVAMTTATIIPCAHLLNQLTIFFSSTAS